MKVLESVLIMRIASGGNTYRSPQIDSKVVLIQWSNSITWPWPPDSSDDSTETVFIDFDRENYGLKSQFKFFKSKIAWVWIWPSDRNYITWPYIGSKRCLLGNSFKFINLDNSVYFKLWFYINKVNLYLNIKIGF